MRIPRELRSLYPFRPHFLETRHGRVHYVDEGDSQFDSIPLVCLHGNPTWSFYYRNIIKHFAPHRRVLAFDYIGCGLSDPQLTPLRLKDHVETIGECVEKLGLGRFDLLLHDWGGAVGIGLSALLPTRISKIALLNSSITPIGPLPKSIQLARAPYIGCWLTRGLNAFLRGALLTCSAKPLPKAVQQGYLYPYRSWATRQAIHQFVRDVPLLASDESYPYLQSLRDFLPSLQDCPVAAFWGMKDFVFTEAHLMAWKTALPNLSVIRYPNAGHWVLEDAAGQIEKDIEVFFQQDQPLKTEQKLCG